MTLVFLGPVPPARVRLLCEAIGRVATRASPIHVELGQGGGRARRGDDGVAWLEVGRGATEITRLARSLEAAVGWRSGPHSAGELPHVTVARRASSRLIADLAGAGGAGASIGWRVDSVVLQRSHLGGAGARYEPVHVVPLGGSVASPGPTLLDGSASGS